jgi:hypothetical protein
MTNMGALLSSAMRSKLERLQEIYLQDVRPASLQQSPLTNSGTHMKSHARKSFVILKPDEGISKPMSTQPIINYESENSAKND